MRANSHAAEICSVPSITKTEMFCGHVMTERRGRSARLAAAHVIDLERVTRLTCRLTSFRRPPTNTLREPHLKVRLRQRSNFQFRVNVAGLE